MLRPPGLFKASKPLNTWLQRRSLLTTTSLFSASNRSSNVNEAVSTEAEDIASVDRLLRAVRERVDTALNPSAMPMRPPGLWSETLLSLALQGASSGAAPSMPPKLQEGSLQPRRMHESYTELVIPFASSPQVLEKYINATGGIRTGKIMEDLDSLAGSIAYKHMLEPGASQVGPLQDRGFYIVTASVERLDMLNQLDPKRDLRLCGQVIYTGKSSMEVVVKMESIDAGIPDETVMIGRFSMVCRNAHTHRAYPVHPLQVLTPEERALYSLGDHMKERRKKAASQSLSYVPPSSNEAADLHTFYLRHGQEGDGSPSPDRVWMGETCIDNCMLMFPQERNVHSKVFGGYLMRLAYELGVTNASLFCRGPVRFLSLDGIAFARPVPIGSILRLESMILHTSSTEEHPVLVHVGVKANVVDVETGLEQTTNDFRFTWYQNAQIITTKQRQVVPKTYHEAMLWLEGRRALETGSQLRGSRKTQPLEEAAKRTA